MIEEFKVELEDSQRIYFSGDDLRGHIILHVKAPYDLKCVAIRFVGEAKFRLPEESLYEKMNLKRKRKQLKNTLKKIRRKNKICPAPITNEDTKAAAGEEKNNVKMKKKRLMRFSSETYFDKRDILFGHNYSSYREHLPAGTHCLPFAFTLPANLPTSYVGRRAFIHYYCEALIERWNKPSVAQKTHFTVSEVVDLNDDPRADISCSVTKNSSCWLLCCPRGTILVTGRLTHQGVVCGQAVPLEADIHNMTNSNINQSYLSIIQVTSYLNSHGIAVCEDERLVLQVKNGRIPKGEFVIWPENKMMKVPPLPPTSQSRTLCKIIVISYRVQIRLKLSMKGDSVTVNLPLIIGNIPFRKDFKNLKYDGDENQLNNRIIFSKSNTKSRLLKQLRVKCIPQFAKNRVKCIPQFAKKTPYSIAGVPCDNPKQTECSYPLPDHVPKCMTFKFSD